VVRPWKILARRVLLSRPLWIEVGDERIELPHEPVVEDFPWIRTRDFATVVAMTPEQQLVLERSYKHGPRQVAVALTAGYVEEGEAPIDSARRELRGETGYAADDWRSLGSFTVYGNYGVCVEHAFLASGARRGLVCRTSGPTRGARTSFVNLLTRCVAGRRFVWRPIS
jgi:ADP-ribose pyrophosphatase YjhB (NUDIX family)